MAYTGQQSPLNGVVPCYTTPGPRARLTWLREAADHWGPTRGARHGAHKGSLMKGAKFCCPLLHHCLGLCLLIPWCRHAINSFYCRSSFFRSVPSGYWSCSLQICKNCTALVKYESPWLHMDLTQNDTAESPGSSSMQSGLVYHVHLVYLYHVFMFSVFLPWIHTIKRHGGGRLNHSRRSTGTGRGATM